MELEPIDADIMSDLGHNFYTGRQYDQAILAFRKALEIEPDLADAPAEVFWKRESIALQARI